MKPATRRTRDTARASAAATALLALLVGVPLLLAAAVGWPLPHQVPTSGWLRHALSAPLSDHDLLDILATVTWLAWAYLLLTVVGEVVTQLRGTTPSRWLRPPGAGPAVHQLVAMILLVLPTMPAAHAAAVPPASVAASITLPPPPQVLSTVTAYPADPTPAAAAMPRPLTAVDTTAATDVGTPAAHRLKQYVVEAPDGGHYDSLWDIAARHLGDGTRYTEIFDLNVGRPQPDGDALTRPRLIRPGWVLLLPPDAHGLGVQDAPAAAPAPAPQPRSAATPDAGAVAGSSHVVIQAPHDPPGTDVATPASTAPADTNNQSASPAATPDRSPQAGHGHHSQLPVDLALGLAAAGAVALLDRARRVAMRRRRRGHRLAPLPAPLQATEAQLRATARQVDPVATALRLGCALTRTQPAPLHVAAVRVHPDGQITLHLADPCPPPIPFTGTDKSWQLAAGDLDTTYQVDALADPLPALAPLGRDRGDCQVLVNLEHAGLTLLATDDRVAADELLTAVTGALLAAPWGDVLIRAYVPAEIAFRLGPLEHLIAVTELADATADVARLAHATRRDVTQAGLTRLDDLRYAGGAEIIALHVFLGWTRDDLPPTLLDLAADPSTDVLAVALTDTDDAHAQWRLFDGTLQVTGMDAPIRLPGSVATAGPLVQHTLSTPNVPAAPAGAGDAGDEGVPHQPLPDRTTSGTAVAGDHAVAEQSAPTAAGDGGRHEDAVDADVDVDPDTGALPSAPMAEVNELTPETPVIADADNAYPRRTESTAADADIVDGGISINVLGPVEITGIADTRHDQVLELLVYLALHPHGATTETIAGAVWTKPITLKNVRNRIGEARARVAGAISDPPRWKLLAPVTSDWDTFRRLARGTANEQQTALTLVRGRPFGEMDHADWLHLDGIRTEVEAAIVDLAMIVGERALAAGDDTNAFTAARAGLRASPYEERLFQIALHAASLQRSKAKMRALMAELESVMDSDVEPADEITAETKQLYRRLLRDLAHDVP